MLSSIQVVLSQWWDFDPSHGQSGSKRGAWSHRCCVLDNPLTQMPALSPEEGTGKKRKRQEEGGRAQPTGNDKLIITLSLKPSEGGCWPGQSDAAVVDGAKPCANPDSVKVGDQVRVTLADASPVAATACRRCSVHLSAPYA